MNALALLISFIANTVWWLVLIYVIMSWLVGFNVINLSNGIVRQIYYTINNLVDPMLDPIRRILPSAGGMDFSPIVLLLIVALARTFILQDLLPLLR